MAVEIERKFLLASSGWRNQVERSEYVVQGYLIDAEAVARGGALSAVRVRLVGSQAWLTVKSATPGVARAEYEYPIPASEAEEMLATLCKGVVEKTRHFVPLDGKVFEIDEFAGANAGLTVAEIELSDADESIPRPAWLGAEVTHDARYYNLNLSSHPYTTWDESAKGGSSSL